MIAKVSPHFIVFLHIKTDIYYFCHYHPGLVSRIQSNLIITQGLPLPFLICIFMAFIYQRESKTKHTNWPQIVTETYHEIFIETKVYLARNNQRVRRSSKTCGGYLHTNSSRCSSQMSDAKTSPSSLCLGSTKALTKAT